MIFSINFYIKLVVAVMAPLICLSGCTAQNKAPSAAISGSPRSVDQFRIAVFPIDNLSATAAPLKEIKQAFISSLKAKGLLLVDDNLLEQTLSSLRVRFVGGLDRRVASAIKTATGADAVLITSLELYSEPAPPKIALTIRLVSTGNFPEVIFVDSVGMAGDDAPGLLDLHLVDNPRELMVGAVERLTGSLAAFVVDQPSPIAMSKAHRKYWPNITYYSPIFDPDLNYSVAVIPFFNSSERKNAGRLMGLHFVREMQNQKNFKVLEPGVARQAMLEMRIIMYDGLSFADIKALFKRLNVDLVLTGKVMDYQDYQGLTGTPKVDFSALLIERRSAEVVWTTKSYHRGDEGVWFFDWGRVNTANTLAAEMVQLAVQDIVN